MLKDLVKATKVVLGKSDKTSGNKYKVKLVYNGKSISMTFHDNYYNKSGKDEFLYSLLMDSLSYENCYNLEDFIDEFGYEDVKLAKKIYQACAKQNQKLRTLFNQQEIEELETEFENF